MAVTMRAGRPEDGPTLQAIERLAGERFRDVGLGFVADHDPASVDELAAYATGGRSWVAVDQADRPVGYLLIDVVDGQAHVEQVSVLPEQQGAGVGRGLMELAEEWAIEQAMSAITLTTFRDVPWNQPLYEHLGYRVLMGDEIGPELRALMAVEADHGLAPAIRVAMRIEVTTPPPG